MAFDVPTSQTPEPGSGGVKRGPAYPKAVDRLVEEFAKLPGIGRRSAERLAFYLLKADEPTAMGLARAITDVKRTVRHCQMCGNFADDSLCGVCQDPRRDRGMILVVEQPKDLIALEQTGMFRGVYHVLLGRLSPLEGVGPSELNLSGLFKRIEDAKFNFGMGETPMGDLAHAVAGGVKVREVILGLNPNVEGDGTGLYLTQELRRRGVGVTRLARGLPSGSQLEYANKAVLADAIQGRQKVD
jgi:recombination protein RecR